MSNFILKSVDRYGVRAQNTNALPRLEGRWQTELVTGAEYLGDREELSIIIDGDRFSEITNFLVNVYGAPYQAPALTPSGYYLDRQFGVAVQFIATRRTPVWLWSASRKGDSKPWRSQVL